MLTQVWCHKYDGTLDLEYSLFDYHCHCAHTRSDDTNLSQSDPPGSVVQSFPGDTSCFNIPEENSRLVRMKTDTYSVVLILSFLMVIDSEHEEFQWVCAQYSGLFPLNKFIYAPDYPVSIDILRC